MTIAIQTKTLDLIDMGKRAKIASQMLMHATTEQKK